MAADDNTKILLVEDHASFRQALAHLLESEPGFEVVAQAGSLAEARKAINASEEIDIAVVDLRLPDGDGVELLREVSAESQNVATLVLSASLGPAEFARAVEAGAAGVLHKAADIDELVNAVRRLRAGEALLSPGEVVRMLRTANTERRKKHEFNLRFNKLTPRELQILEALAEGLDSKEIARRLHTTLETERTHVVNLLKKLGANSRLQALVFAVRHDLVEIR